MTTLKILVVGGGHGRALDLLAKIATLHSKQSFSIAIIVGDLFGPQEQSSENESRQSDDEDVEKLINGEVTVPVLTYFTLGKTPLPSRLVSRLQDNEGVLCENLEFLGKRTTLTTSDGVRIVALGGNLDRELSVDHSKDRYLPFYSIGDANTLRGAKKADILLTSDWPESVRTGSSLAWEASAETAPHEENSIARLCAALKPRYHFSTSNAGFYEREPFFHPPDPDSSADGFHTTRFISIAVFGNAAKQKWAYAFTLDPKAALPSMIPAGCTPSPFQFLDKKRPAASQYGHQHEQHGGKHKQRKRHKPGPAECFFCLGNPNLAAHMVASIGSDAYLATAKGPLSTNETFPQLEFPCHMLIIPLPHVARLSGIGAIEERNSATSEMQKYRTALHDLLSSKAGKRLGSVTWEISREGGVHTHWQFMPVPSDMVERKLVEAAFKKEAQNDALPAFEYTDSKLEEDGTVDCLKVSIWRPGATAEVNLRLALSGDTRLDVQFPRRVLAKLLRLDERMHWRDCVQSEADEAADAEAIKAAYSWSDSF